MLAALEICSVPTQWSVLLPLEAVIVNMCAGRRSFEQCKYLAPQLSLAAVVILPRQRASLPIAGKGEGIVRWRGKRIGIKNMNIIIHMDTQSWRDMIDFSDVFLLL